MGRMGREIAGAALLGGVLAGCGGKSGEDRMGEAGASAMLGNRSLARGTSLTTRASTGSDMPSASRTSTLRVRLRTRSAVCCGTSTRTTAAVFTVLIGALCFGYFLTITQTPQHVTEFLTGLGIGRYGVLALILLMYLVLGCLMDAMAMIILTVPIVFPVVTAPGCLASTSSTSCPVRASRSAATRPVRPAPATTVW